MIQPCIVNVGVPALLHLLGSLRDHENSSPKGLPNEHLQNKVGTVYCTKHVVSTTAMFASSYGANVWVSPAAVFVGMWVFHISAVEA